MKIEANRREKWKIKAYLRKQAGNDKRKTSRVGNTPLFEWN
jgi:hypothetical protein